MGLPRAALVRLTAFILRRLVDPTIALRED